MVSFAYLAYKDDYVLPQLSDAQIKKDIGSAMLSVSPTLVSWSIVWGPVSYTVPGAVYPENLMYVVKLESTSTETQYAVAIRGTNGKVLLDWLLEDFDIIQMIPWSSFAPNAPGTGNISESTSIGLTILLNMLDPITFQTLVEFLKSEMLSAGPLPVNPISLCVTGHSLGGTLASALALYLRDNQQPWDPASKATVTTIHFAAPTAGDSDFANHFDATFTYTGQCPLPLWVDPNVVVTSKSFADCVRNQYDIARLVWNTADMNQIEQLYSGESGINAPFGTSEIITAITSATTNNGYTQVQLYQTLLSGALIPSDQLPPGVKPWIAEAEAQHTLYASLLQVTGLPSTSPLPAIVAVPQKATGGAV